MLHNDNFNHAFNAAFCRRTRELRHRTGMTMAEMANSLGVPKDRYAKYECRSPLPHYLVGRFLSITSANFEDLFSYRKIPA